MTPSERWNAWLLIATGIWLQALPFLLLGTAMSAALNSFLTVGALRRFIPRRGWLAVPLGGLAGMLLPACECASVPTIRSLIRAGVPTPAALTFMAASPGINPVVLASTAVAYIAMPQMVLARFLGGFVAAILLGLMWRHLGTPLRGQGHLERDAHDHCDQQPPPGQPKWRRFRRELVADFTEAAGYLVVGAAVAATIKTVIPTTWLDALTGNLLWAILALMLLAIVVALCSEADAFMAVSLTAFPPIAQLAFLVVGPIVDAKLMAMQGGAFGTRFMVRYALLGLACSFVSAAVVGFLVLG